MFADSAGAVRAVVLEGFDSQDQDDLVGDIERDRDLVVGEVGVQDRPSSVLAEPHVFNVLPVSPPSFRSVPALVLLYPNPTHTITHKFIPGFKPNITVQTTPAIIPDPVSSKVFTIPDRVSRFLLCVIRKE